MAKFPIKKLFELQTSLTSYAYPLIKLLVSAFIVCFGVFRNHLFTIQTPWVDFIVTLICLQLVLFAILCIYISIGELFYVRKNRRNCK